MFLTNTHHNGHANLPVAIISQNTNVLHHHVIDLQCRECGSHTSEKLRKITLIEEICTIALVRQRRGQMENSSVPSVTHGFEGWCVLPVKLVARDKKRREAKLILNQAILEVTQIAWSLMFLA